jgi:hypothetical protein
MGTVTYRLKEFQDKWNRNFEELNNTITKKEFSVAEIIKAKGINMLTVLTNIPKTINSMLEKVQTEGKAKIIMQD